MSTKMTIAAIAVIVLALVCADAKAKPDMFRAGSCLIFPYFDSSPGSGTIITVTNLNDDASYCEETDFRYGDSVIHYRYIDGETTNEYNRYEFLTPGDTLSVIADNHNPQMNTGFLVVNTVDPTDYFRPHEFNFLIGSAIVVESDLELMWQYRPVVLRGVPVSPDPCARESTDLDGDGALDFDDVEYASFPAEIYVDAFFEEGGVFGNKLILMSTSGRTRTSEVELLIRNNIGETFSASFEMDSFWMGSLAQISGTALDLKGDPEELPLSIETGWITLSGGRILDRSGNPIRDADGDNAVAPILGVFVQYISNPEITFGSSLHHRGSLDGLEFFTGNDDPQQKGKQP